MYKLMEDILYYRARLAFTERINEELGRTGISPAIQFFRERLMEKERELYLELSYKYGQKPWLLLNQNIS